MNKKVKSVYEIAQNYTLDIIKQKEFPNAYCRSLQFYLAKTYIRLGKMPNLFSFSSSSSKRQDLYSKKV